MRRQPSKAKMNRHARGKRAAEQADQGPSQREKRMLPETYPETSQRSTALGVHRFCSSRQARDGQGGPHADMRTDSGARLTMV